MNTFLITITFLILASLLGYLLYLQNTYTKPLKINPKFLAVPKSCVEFVFECEGIKYYKYTDEFNLPVERSMSALDIYAELDLKVSHEFLKTHCLAINEAINKGQLTTIAALNRILESNINTITNVDLLYKLASVLYFCEAENPNVYDYSTAQKKIASWKREKDMHAFFLQMPISVYLPSFNTSELNLEAYTLLQRKEMLSALKFHLSLLSETDISPELKSDLIYRITELESLTSSEN